MRDAPDKYRSETIQTTFTHTDISLQIHHSNTFSCKQQKQSLLDENILNHIQFDQERNLSYLLISTLQTLKRKRHLMNS